MNGSVRILIAVPLALLANACDGRVATQGVAGMPPSGAGTPSTVPSIAPPAPMFASGSPAPAEQLDVDIEIAGMSVASAQLACGQCVDITASARGGLPPYSYAWSDPALSGSGPNHVCPRSSADYVVHVTDTPPQGEIRRPSLQGEARLHLDVAPCRSMSEPGPGATKDAGALHVTPPPTHHDAGRPKPSADGSVPRVRDGSLPPPSSDGGRRICPCSNDWLWIDDYFVDSSFEDPASPSRTACSGNPTPSPLLGQGLSLAPDGARFLDLPLDSSFSETLQQPLRAGQRYWLSWDMWVSSQITALTGIPLGEIDVVGTSTPCAAGESLAVRTFRPSDPTEWLHVCMEFVPTRDYPSVTITARVANGTGTGYVNIDVLRVAPYEPSPTDYLWPSCAELPVGEPFP